MNQGGNQNDKKVIYIAYRKDRNTMHLSKMLLIIF